jgi:adenylate kinase
LHECKTPLRTCKNIAPGARSCFGAGFILHECKTPLRTCKNIAPGAKKWRQVPIEFNVNLGRISKTLGLDPKVQAATNLNLDEVLITCTITLRVLWQHNKEAHSNQHSEHKENSSFPTPPSRNPSILKKQTPPRSCSPTTQPKTQHDDTMGPKSSGPDAAANTSQRRKRNRRARPNVLITGTPGTGKTALATLLSVRTQLLRVRHPAVPVGFVVGSYIITVLALFIVQEQLDLRHVNVGEMVMAHKCYEGRDEALDTYVLDEDKLLDALEPILEDFRQNHEGVVLDYHACDFFPERYFDLVLVLQCHTDILYDRLSSRNYSDLKRSENVTAEIMQVIWEEAQQSYDSQIVHAVPSNTIQDMDSNVDRVRTWMEQWIRDRREEEVDASGSSEEDADALKDDEEDDDDDIST